MVRLRKGIEGHPASQPNRGCWTLWKNWQRRLCESDCTGHWTIQCLFMFSSLGVDRPNKSDCRKGVWNKTQSKNSITSFLLLFCPILRLHNRNHGKDFFA